MMMIENSKETVSCIPISPPSRIISRRYACPTELPSNCASDNPYTPRLPRNVTNKTFDILYVGTDVGTELGWDVGDVGMAEGIAEGCLDGCVDGVVAGCLEGIADG